MRHVPLLLGFAMLLILAPARACLNDRDTLRNEAEGFPDVLRVVSGRFERNPPLYYQMRIQREQAELTANPNVQNHYDDIGVAWDRIGNDDQAIAWMAKKKQHLPTYSKGISPATKEQWYRYYANLGTFHMHHWVRTGASRENLTEVKQARDLIAHAIAIKPNAHFGREKYQLQVINWVLNSPRDEAGNLSPLTEYLGNDDAKPRIKALTGLIILGNAWESPDIFDALGQAVGEDHSYQISFLCYCRVHELNDTGHAFIKADTQKTPNIGTYPADANIDERFLTGFYHELRRSGDAWQKARTDFMMERLRQGRHPDTDSSFRNGYQELPEPTIPMSPHERTLDMTVRLRQAFDWALLIGPIIGITILIIRISRRR